jgi:ribonuclease HI
MSQQKFYVVWKGKNTGIFSSWEECSAQVTGFNGAQYKSFESQAAAEAAFNAPFEDYIGKHIPNLSTQKLVEIGQPLADSYCVDASCIGNPGLMEYRCVHTTTRKELFHQGPFNHGTNNIGEFLAIVHTLALFKKRSWNYPIYTDSETALVWVSKSECKTKLHHIDNNKAIFELISRAEDWLKTNKVVTPILKWETGAWGEIPADYGRK